MTHRDFSHTHLGRFELMGLLGQGGMAAVYQARQTDLDRLVALKILHPELAHDPDTVTRFHEEARHAARLEHPNIVPIYDIGELEAPDGPLLHYIAMKYVSGQTLGSLLEQRGPMPVLQAIDLLDQAGAALDYAHQQGMVHRDVKPSNILLADDGSVYLSDFGLARQVASTRRLTRGSVVMGTPEYMAPEQVEGKADIGPAADIYALGVVLYEMLSGALPFDADTPMGMAVARLTSEPRALPGMPGEVTPALEAILMRALARDPARRYASVAEMVGALRQLPAVPSSSAQTHSSQFYALPAASTGKTVALAQQAPPPQPASGGSGDDSSHSASGGSSSGSRWHPWTVGAVLALVLLFVGSTAYTMSRNAIPLPPPSTATPVIVGATAAPPRLPPTMTPGIRTNPAVARLTQQGWTHFENTRYNEAAQSFEEAERQNSGDPEPAYGQGRAHLVQGQYEQAIEDLTRAVRLGSEYGVRESAEVYAWLGEAYIQQGTARDVPGSRDAAAIAYEQAEQAYRRAVSLHTGPMYTMSDAEVQAFSHTGLGWVLYYQGDYTEARTQFEASLSIDHDQVTAHNGLAWTLYTQGDYQNAYSHFHQALAIDDDYANAQYGLGLASEELNREREARDAFEKTLEIDPTYEEARERLEQLNPAPFP